MTRDAGLTLIEVLIAMLIVLVVTAGSLAFVARGRDAGRAAESLAQLEESLDAALAVLVDGIRESGFLGLAPPMSAVGGATPVGAAESPELAVAGSCGASLAHDLAQPLAAADGAYRAAPAIAIGCRASPGGRARAMTDTLILRHAAALPAQPAAGRLQLETNLRAASLRADGIAHLGPEARWHDLEVGVYYLSEDSTGRPGWPSLRRKRLVGGTRPSFQDEELVSGIVDFQVELGVDDAADVDVSVDRWIAPRPVSGGEFLRAVRIELEAVSDIAEGTVPGGARRKRVSRIVELRNGGAAG